MKHVICSMDLPEIDVGIQTGNYHPEAAANFTVAGHRVEVSSWFANSSTVGQTSVTGPVVQWDDEWDAAEGFGPREESARESVMSEAKAVAARILAHVATGLPRELFDGHYYHDGLYEIEFADVEA